MHPLAEGKEPLYVTIKRELLSKIEQGTWPIGFKIPNEDTLEEQYKVSRGTIRRALADLETDGYITRQAARGTFVTRIHPRPRLHKNIGEIVSFSQQLARSGFEPSVRLLSAQVVKASEAPEIVREGFGIPPDDEVIHIKRLRLGNDIPFAIQSVYLLPRLCPGILEGNQNEELKHLFKLYKQKYNRRILMASETMRLSCAWADEAELLQIGEGEPVIIRDRVSFADNDLPFEVLHSVDRPDRFSYQYMIMNDLTSVSDTVEQKVSQQAEKSGS